MRFSTVALSTISQVEDMVLPRDVQTGDFLVAARATTVQGTSIEPDDALMVVARTADDEAVELEDEDGVRVEVWFDDVPATVVGVRGWAVATSEALSEEVLAESGHEVKVAVWVNATSQHEANERVFGSLPRDLDAVVLS